MGLRQVKNKNNTSGYLGVSWSKEKNKWHAKLGVGRRRIHIGYFNSIEKAAKAYVLTKKKYIKGIQ